ncbi:MAG: preprotein translocase subunit SecE [Cycloclasticus sp.]|nr:preprotein translocase subunit SecE [Cycloclasticus sp. 46_120_T64]
MNAETEQSSGQLDVVKLGLSILVLVAGIAGFYFFGEYSLLLRVIALLVVLSMSLALVYTTNLGQSFWQFAQGSTVELRKIVWPTKKETMQTTLIVVVMVLFVGILLWMFDGLLMWAISYITG